MIPLTLDSVTLKNGSQTAVCFRFCKPPFFPWGEESHLWIIKGSENTEVQERRLNWVEMWSPKRRPTWSLSVWKQGLWSYNDGSWLEITLDSFTLGPKSSWGQRDTERKATERGRQRLEPRSQKPHHHGLLAGCRPGACAEQVLPQTLHKEPTLLTPWSQSSDRTYFCSFKPPSLQYCVTTIPGN